MANGFSGQPNEPFFFGRGGRRLTPQDIALERRIGMQQAQADFSPVQHWTQGLGRLANNVVGNLNLRRTDQAEQANKAEADAVLAALLGQGEAAPTQDTVLGALANPYVPEDVKQVAGQMWERMNPKAPQPTEYERMLANAGILPGTPEFMEANRRAALAKGDPFITANLPGGNFYAGPQSSLAEVLKGGGQSSGAAPGSPPAQLPPDFDFGAPSMANTPSPDLGANGNPSMLTQAQYQAVVAKMGKQRTDEWAQRNGIRIEGR